MIACPHDGSPLILDTTHARLVASQAEPGVFPLMWRCVNCKFVVVL